MRTRHRIPVPVLAFLFVLLTTGAGFAQETPAIQWAPVPADPNELVTGGAKALTNPQERSAALQLLDRARQNYTLYGPHAPAFALKVSFTSNGQLQYEGQGSMQETWTGWAADRWTAKIGSTETLRVIYRRQMWSDNPSAPVPMRVQMVRSALLWPVMNMPPRVMLRAAAASIAGKAVMCILTSAWMPTADQARHWFEQEYCVDPESGNLLVWSEAPGHYVLYDYTASTEFQGHVIANDISIYEAGSRVMQIHVDSIQDASGVNPESLRPTPQLMAKGPSFSLGPPMRFPIPVKDAKGPIPTAIQPVLVHATIDRDGHVLEAEALQNSNPELAAKAIGVLRSRMQSRGSVQREVFVNVEFMTGSPQVAAAQ
jgi:hypothetical protein